MSLVGRRWLGGGILTPHLCDSLSDHFETGQFTVNSAKDGVANSSASRVETLAAVPLVSAGSDAVEMRESLSARVSAAVKARGRSSASRVVVPPLIPGNVAVGKVLETASVLLGRGRSAPSWFGSVSRGEVGCCCFPLSACEEGGAGEI